MLWFWALQVDSSGNEPMMTMMRMMKKRTNEAQAQTP